MDDNASPPVVNIEIVKVRGDRRERQMDIVVKEAICSIVVNGTRVTSMPCTPSDLEGLAVGFLLSEGIIASYADVQNVRVDEGIIGVETRDKAEVADRIASISSGRSSKFPSAGGLLRARKVVSELTVSVGSIVAIVKGFGSASELFRSTGGVHSAAICEQDGIVLLMDDIGRHNAVDKVLGACSIKGIPTEDKMLLLTGRVSSDVLMKAALRGIPVIISLSAPTHLAIELAIEYGITLVGFARGDAMNIYSHDRRIISE